MNGLPRHPGTEEIAEYQAGATDGARGDQVAAHLAECSACSALSTGLEQVPLILASVPPPALPSGVEARVMAALTAESEARSASRITADGRSRHLFGRDPAGASPGGRPPVPPEKGALLRQSLIAPLGVLAAAAACLILAFVGLRLSDQSHPSGRPASAAAGGSSSPVRVPGHAIAGGVAGGVNKGPGPRQNSTSPALRQPAPFPVLVSSVNFQSSTFQAQVRAQLAEAQIGGNRIAPSSTLMGCVTRVADGARVSLVDEARYQSRPAYVIVIPDHAWIVARQCTRAHPAMMASVAISPSR